MSDYPQLSPKRQCGFNVWVAFPMHWIAREVPPAGSRNGVARDDLLCSDRGMSSEPEGMEGKGDSSLASQ